MRRVDASLAPIPGVMMLIGNNTDVWSIHELPWGVGGSLIPQCPRFIVLCPSSHPFVCCGWVSVRACVWGAVGPLLFVHGLLIVPCQASREKVVPFPDASFSRCTWTVRVHYQHIRGLVNST